MHKFLITVLLSTFVFWYAFIKLLIERSPDNAIIVGYAQVLLFGVITLTTSLLIFGIKKITYYNRTKQESGSKEVALKQDVDWKLEYRKGLGISSIIALVICFLITFRILTNL